MSSWADRLSSYARHVADERTDSFYLRKHGLQRHVLELAGPCEGLSVLDVGSGTGWVVDALQPNLGAECDVVHPDHDTTGRHFSIQDARDLHYPPESFDLVVCSLSLMWFEELDLACSSMHRVAKKGGRLIVALTHPLAYRRGTATMGRTVL